jgi:hypothetical protein
MKTLFLILLLSSVSAFANLSLSISTDHFLIESSNPKIARAEAIKISEMAEEYYQRLSNYLGKENTPAKINIVLEGNAYDEATHQFNYPNVDPAGVVHLYIFPGESYSYSEGLPHELVHAFRTKTWGGKSHQDYMKGFGFVEEGFAEFASIQVAPEFVGFVRYGYPLAVVVGSLIEGKKEIPLSVLFDHHEINPKCIAQAYPLRASFFSYLNETFGKEKVFKLAYSSDVTKSTFEDIFGRPFDELVAQWKSYAEKSYSSTPNAETLKKDYVEKTPVKYFPTCVQGTDW